MNFLSLLKKPWVSLLFFVVGFFLAKSVGLYAYIPFLGSLGLYFLYPDTYSSKSVGEIKEETKEKAKSILRSVIQVVGVLIVLGGFGIKIPYVEQVQEAANYLTANIDIAAEALNVVIGIVLTLYGLFKNPERFEARAGNPYSKNKLS